MYTYTNQNPKKSKSPFLVFTQFVFSILMFDASIRNPSPPRSLSTPPSHRRHHSVGHPPSLSSASGRCGFGEIEG